MIALFLGAQLLDLGTFLAGMRVLPVSAELGPIGMVWANLGDLGAIAVKLAGMSIVLTAVALSANRRGRIVLGLAVVAGIVGAVGNLYAIWQVS